MKQITNIHCSALSRVMTCSGSLFFDLPRPPTNPAAEEGTAAGEYLERLLLGMALPEQAKNGVTFDDDMKYYTSAIAEDIKSRAGDGVLCENPIDWMTRSGIMIKGRYDASYTCGDVLHVEDLKYGWNIVDVNENWQLIGYAIGEVMRRQRAFNKIILTIQQPRPHHEDGPKRSWELSYAQLLEYKEQIEVKLEQIAADQLTLVTSPKCKYCPAVASACPAFNRAVFAGIDVVLNDVQQDDIDDKEVAFQLDLLSRVTDVLKIKTGSLNELAVNRIKDGKIIPGYMTEQSYGDRKWKKEVSPLVIETLTGISIQEKIMLSPAKAEKLGVPKELVKGYVDRHFLGMKLVKKDGNKLGDKIFGKKEV